MTPRPRKARVQIDRGGMRGASPYESFHGIVVGETTTHFRVQWVSSNDACSVEWFAKAGPRVQCVELDEDMSPLVPLEDKL